MRTRSRTGAGRINAMRLATRISPAPAQVTPHCLGPDPQLPGDGFLAHTSVRQAPNRTPLLLLHHQRPSRTCSPGRTLPRFSQALHPCLLCPSGRQRGGHFRDRRGYFFMTDDTRLPLPIASAPTVI